MESQRNLDRTSDRTKTVTGHVCPSRFLVQTLCVCPFQSCLVRSEVTTAAAASSTPGIRCTTLQAVRLLDSAGALISAKPILLDSNGQKRVHPEAAWPEPGTPLSGTLTARFHRPKPAYTWLWPLLKRVHPVLATYPPIDYPIPTTLPDYGRAIRPVSHTRKHTRTRTQPPSTAPPTSGGAFFRPMNHTPKRAVEPFGPRARGA